MSEAPAPGFFGKLPDKGDFVEQRLSRDFVTNWDAWLQQSIATSQAQLGAEWLEIYLTSPLWRFAVSKGVLGDSAYVGVTMPSVDKVGRYFPLSIALESPETADPLSILVQHQDWFVEAEDTLLSVLDDPPRTLAEFDDLVAGLALDFSHDLEPVQFPASGGNSETESTLLQFSLQDQDSLRNAGCPVAGAAANALLGSYSAWSTSGSDRVGASLLLCSSLPSPDNFAAFLDGNWAGHGWLAQQVSGAAALAEPADLVAPISAAMSDAGHERDINEDAYACRDDLGVWLVADGLGGHQAGELASALVAETISDLPAFEELESRVETIKRHLRLAQASLHQMGKQFDDVAHAASTVVALALDGSQAACLWAGDSRVYRLRQGEIKQLTIDHADAEDGDEEASSNAITRAVGGEDALHIDARYVSLQAGDRFLLCSDGLYRELDLEQLTRLLSTGTPAEACDTLREAVLETDAPDNLTAVVVDVPMPDPLDALLDADD